MFSLIKSHVKNFFIFQFLLVKPFFTGLHISMDSPTNLIIIFLSIESRLFHCDLGSLCGIKYG